jgi:hypothetical protein
MFGSRLIRMWRNDKVRPTFFGLGFETLENCSFAFS